MQERTYRVGIVGADVQASWAGASHIPALAAQPSLVLAAVATRREESARAAAETFGAERWFADPYAMVASDDVDIVTVAVKVPAHRDLVMAALAAGKAVYCEAPLGATLAEPAPYRTGPLRQAGRYRRCGRASGKSRGAVHDRLRRHRRCGFQRVERVSARPLGGVIVSSRQEPRLSGPLRLCLLVATLAAAAASFGTFAAERRAPAAPPAARFAAARGEIVVTSIQQMSVVLTTPAGVIVTDPKGGAERYGGHPTPDVILVSHEHAEHFDAATLSALRGPATRIVVPPYVMQRLPQELKSSAISLAGGDSAELGGMEIRAIPSYGLSREAARWHPPGRGNSYLVTVADRRIFIGGSTEAVPEAMALRDIDLAVLPLYPPYALGPEDAARLVAAVRPGSVYVYQYNSTGSRDDFVRRLNDLPFPVEIFASDIP